MQIKKYLHSCILIEESGKKLLFDPGAFVFIEGKFKPEEIVPVDVVVVTHSHPDHFFPEALKEPGLFN
jgi:L-ascorbate metabolism protein UlaG (beta-lactamase superfamily)